MGRARIIENQGDGKYLIELLYKSDYSALLSKLAARLVAVEQRLADLLTQKNIWLADISAQQSILNALINTIPMDEMKINETVSAIQKLTSQLARIEILLTEAQQKKTDIEAKNAVVIGLRDKASIPRQAWCVAYYDQLSGEVDTIEIDDQSDEILVAAEGATTDEGQLKHLLLGCPAETFWNIAMLPGVQTWKPRYKLGTITALDYKENTCSVTLIETSMTGLDTLAANTLKNVPIKYMSCNSTAFIVGDEVVIEFQNRMLNAPRVIGFRANPRPCQLLLLIKIAAVGYTDYVIVWNVGKNSYHEIVHDPPIEFPCTYATLAFWLENTVVVGSNLFATEAGGFAIEDWNGIPFDCTIATPSNETCQKTTNIPSLLLGPAGESGLQNTRQVMRIGNNYRPSCYEEVHYIWDDIALATRHDLQAMNIPYSQHTYDIYDVPFPTIGLIAQNDSGYIGSVGTRFFTGHGETPYPWFFQYRNYYGTIRYDENVTKQYRVITPLGLMLSAELYSYFTKYPDASTEYIIRKISGAQGLVAGQYVENGFCQIYLMQYSTKITTKARNGVEGSVNQNRVVMAKAQSIIAPDAGKTSPYNSLPHNTELATAIETLVAAWYNGNGMTAADIVDISLNFEIIAG